MIELGGKLAHLIPNCQGFSMTNLTTEPLAQHVSLDDLTPHARNYNRHPAAQIERLRASLRAYGQPRPIVVHRGTILAGHGVAMAARAEGWRQIWCSIVPDAWDESRALAYLVADNETRRGSEPDDEALLRLIEETREGVGLESLGFDESALQALMDEMTPAILGQDDVVGKDDRAGSSPWDRIAASDTARCLIGDIEFGIPLDLIKAWSGWLDTQDGVAREVAAAWLSQHMQSLTQL